MTGFDERGLGSPDPFYSAEARAEAARKQHKRENPTTLIGEFNKWGTGNDARWWQQLIWFSVCLGLVALFVYW